MQPPNYGLNSDEDSDSEEGTDSQHLSADQLIAQADFRIDFGTRITNSLEAECDDIEKWRQLGKRENFSNVLENERSGLSKWLSKMRGEIE